jgi:hypothetical protein
VRHELWVDTNAGCYGHGSEGDGGGWRGLRQVVLLRITREFPGQMCRLPVVEDHFYLTNIPATHRRGTPQALLGIARGHWEIENGLHWVKDATMGEDACRNKKAALGLAWMRNIAMFLLQFVAGDSVPQKQLLLGARGGAATRLVSIRRRPRRLVGEL